MPTQKPRRPRQPSAPAAKSPTVAPDNSETEPLAVAPSPGCSGAVDCEAVVHEHGCYADVDGSACTDPDEHDITVVEPVDIGPFIDRTVREIQALDSRSPGDGEQPPGSLAAATARMLEARQTLDQATATRDALLEHREQLVAALEILGGQTALDRVAR